MTNHSVYFQNDKRATEEWNLVKRQEITKAPDSEYRVSEALSFISERQVVTEGKRWRVFIVRKKEVQV